MTKRRRQRAAAAVILPALLLAFGYVGWTAMFDPRGTRLKSLFQGPEDGVWVAATLDGNPLRGEYRVRVGRGEIVGGYDGCNHWAYGGIDRATGSRSVETTLVGCQDTAESATMRRLMRGRPKLILLPDNRLRLEGDGHSVLLRRVRSDG
jgi:hypothetical protein